MRASFLLVGPVGVPFCCAAEAALFPPRSTGECFLLAADVAACGVDFIVALGLEVVQNGVVCIQGGDPSTG